MIMMQSKLIGRYADIKDRPGEWGIIIDYDGDWYYLAWCGDVDVVPVFCRDELHIPRKAPAWVSDMCIINKISR